MNCEQYKDLIQEFHDGELPRESEAFLFIHLASCEDCREFLKLLYIADSIIEQEKVSFPYYLDERILRKTIPVKMPKRFFERKLPAYVTYAVTILLIALTIFAFNLSSRQNDELRLVINALNEQNKVVKEQSNQLLMLMNGLPETSITSELENKIIINAKM